MNVEAIGVCDQLNSGRPTTFAMRVKLGRTT